MIRAISHTEADAVVRCEASWDFRYGGRLAGSALRKRDVAPVLREGRAWGRAVAAFHEADEDGFDAGLAALVTALEEDADQQKELGVYDSERHLATADKLRAEFAHYTETTERLPIEALEREFLVPLPSRSGRGLSNKYYLQAFVDGVHRDAAGRLWIVEFKLRSNLSSLDQLYKDRQPRRYAWAYRQETGEDIAGVIVDERLNEAPKPARFVNGRKKGVGIERVKFDEKAGKDKPYWVVPSETKEQLTTPDRYLDACREAGVEPNQETVDALTARRWQQREPVFFTEQDMQEAGEELVSLGQHIADLDSHRRYPVRATRPANCNGCFFKEICGDPHETELVDALFERTPPKRERDPKQQREEVKA